VGIAEHDDSIYTAPEVKNRKKETPTADAYSLGIILVQVLTGQEPRQGQMPAAIWEMSPALGRMFDDLIEQDPLKRLLLHPSGPLSFEALGRTIDLAFQLALKEPGLNESGFKRLLARLAPTSREVSAQFRQLRTVRKANAQPPYELYLLGFSVIATTCWWFIVAKAALEKLDDIVTLQWRPLPQGDALAAAIIALSQGLVAAKFYQTMLARITTRGIPGVFARFTEAAVRYMAVVALPTTIFAVFWRPDLWAWMGALGAAAVALANWLTFVFAKRILEAGEGKLSSVPPGTQVSSRGYEQWWWTMLLYAGVIAVIALGLQVGWMRDTAAYVFGLVVISVGIHYASKCVVAGPAIRGELAHAFCVGERLSILRASGAIELREWPPKIGILTAAYGGDKGSRLSKALQQNRTSNSVLER
jgi:hypothetical protein